MKDAQGARPRLYHSFLTGVSISGYAKTQCGVWLRERENNISLPWCDECLSKVRIGGGKMLVKLIDHSFHLPKYPGQMSEKDFQPGEWRQTACGKLVKFGSQSRHDAICEECRSKLSVSMKKSGKLRDVVDKVKQAVAKRGKRRKLESIPEVSFMPTAEVVALIKKERRRSHVVST